MNKLWLTILFLLCAAGAELKQSVGLDALISGADAFARGGAYIAETNSRHYVFQNYALLPRSPVPQISFTTFKLISELTYLSAAYNQGNFGVGVLHMQDTGGYVRDSAGNLQGGQIGYRDDTVYGAYGRSFGQRDEYAWGGRIKYQNKYFSETDVYAQGLSLDLAGAYLYAPYLAWGAELTNAINTSLRWSNGLEEYFSRNLVLGGRFKVWGPDSYWPGSTQSLYLYTDLRLHGLEDCFWQQGAEYWPSKYIVLRAGFKQLRKMADQTSDKEFKFTAGLGFNYYNVFIDYAYDPGDDIASNVTHYFTVSYRWSDESNSQPPIKPAQQPRPKPLKEIIEKQYQKTFTETLDSLGSP